MLAGQTSYSADFIKSNTAYLSATWPAGCLLDRSNVPNEENVFFILVTGNTEDTNADGTFALKWVLAPWGWTLPT